jgi:hypothetical protein
MEERVYGLENEYVLLYEPAEGELLPPNQHAIYQELEAHIRERFATLPARGGKGGVFLANGARLHYEARLQRFEQGLAELSTPECASPRELGLHHRAIDDILRKAQILRDWERALGALERDPSSLDGVVDWVTKYRLLEEVAGGPQALEEVAAWARALHTLDSAPIDDDDLEAEGAQFWERLAARMHQSDRRELEAEITRSGLDPDRLPAMARLGYQLCKVDLKYHDLDPEEGYASLLARAGGISSPFSPEEISRARAEPPAGTRARGHAIARAASAGHRAGPDEGPGAG